MKPLAPLAICARCPRPATKTCSQCKMMSYCSAAHQREDWKDVHKIECPALKAAAETARDPGTGLAALSLEDRDCGANLCSICLVEEDTSEGHGMCYSCGAFFCHSCGWECQKATRDARGKAKSAADVIDVSQGTKCPSCQKSWTYVKSRDALKAVCNLVASQPTARHRGFAAREIAHTLSQWGGFALDRQGKRNLWAHVVTWYRIAAADDIDPFGARFTATQNLAVSLKTGDKALGGAGRDPAEALRLFHVAEEILLEYTATRKMSREVRQDLANTRRCIGEMYRDGLGTARNKKLAADYLAKSRLLAESRHTSEGIALNNENKYYAAMKHLQRGVDEDGCSEAMFYIGSLHFYGRGTAVDRHEAFKWYLRAAEKGHVMAMNNVAGCYMRGEGGEQSMEKSRYWLEKAVFKKCDAARETLRGMDENPLTPQQMEFFKLFSKVVGPKTIKEGYTDHLL
jgi:TPR repeat protein